MGSSKRTPIFRFAQFVANDKPSWLGDFNGFAQDVENELVKLRNENQELRGFILNLQKAVNK